MAPDAIVVALAPYDIGLVIDRPETDNARLALPNKLFEYMMAGLAVAVPRAPRWRSSSRREGVGASTSRAASARHSQRLAADREALEAMRPRARAAVERYNAEAAAARTLRAWGL